MNIFKKENSSYQNMSFVTYNLREKKPQTALNSLEITVSKQNNIVRNRVYLKLHLAYVLR